MKGPGLSIRPFRADDVPALQRIRAAAFAPVFGSFRAIVGDDIAGIALARADAEQAQHLSDLCGPESKSQILVALVDDVPVGFVAFSMSDETKVGEIGLNAVHPDHAGRGIGAAMYDDALARMKAAGMAVANVGTGGDASHAPARRAYEKVGFGTPIPSLYYYKRL
ncbi:MAG: GNAT family N-acetyltransferase [Rhodospirillaceae bacterium]|nr:GNAT family N-acetyltransferase [Rhodospirillaceae bacterium]